MHQLPRAWNSLSVTPARRSLPKPRCAKPFTVSNIRARPGSKTFSPACCSAKPPRCWTGGTGISSCPCRCPLKKRERGIQPGGHSGAPSGRGNPHPVLSNVLRRIVPTATQTVLSREKRATNMQGAFAVPDGLRLKDKRIVIVDDIFTTGATTNACARALRKAGAADVCVWTVARGL